LRPKPVEEVSLVAAVDPQAETLRRARTVSLAFVLCVGVYGATQWVFYLWLGMPALLSPDAMLVSALVNSTMVAVVLGYRHALLRLPLAPLAAQRRLERLTLATGLLVMTGWSVQLHLGGSGSCHVLPVVLGSLLGFSWILPLRQVGVLVACNAAFLVLITGLEMSGVLPYAPLIRGDTGVLRAFFLDWHVILVNVLIYVGGVVGVGYMLVRLRQDLEGQRDALARSNARLRAALEQVKRSNEDLGEFASVVSHDLRAPLRTIGFYADLLWEESRQPEGSEAQAWYQSIRHNLSDLDRMTRDLLRYARLDAGEPLVASCDLNTLLDGVLEMLRASIQEAGAQVTRDALPTVPGDPNRLTQLLQNLLANALTYRGVEPPRVHVAVSQDADCWHFRVIDNGAGFDPAYAERIFRVFERLHSGPKREGTGIGLAVCRKIVERMGGRIWAESQPGRGSTFHFTLPTPSSTIP
jgi:signal transduction histidine kinase